MEGSFALVSHTDRAMTYFLRRQACVYVVVWDGGCDIMVHVFVMVSWYDGV